MTVKEAGSPNRREEGSNAGCLALQSGEEVTNYYYRNHDEEIDTVIGDEKQEEFFPRMKIKKWDNECNFSVGLIDATKSHRQVGDKIEWVGNNLRAMMYPVKTPDSRYMLPDQFEFEIIFDGVPASNIVEMSITTKGLDFFYQPPLTQQEISAGHEQPENVVGSYAVYHKTQKGDYSAVGGKNYRAGKAFHIYRPKIVDVNGDWIWGDLHIDVKSSRMTIEIDRTWLDNAVYPITVDPTFGHAGVGLGWRPMSADLMCGSLFTSPSDALTANNIKAYGDKDHGAAFNLKGIVVLHSTLNIIASGVGSAVAGVDGGWVTSVLSANPAIAASTGYVLMVISDAKYLLRRDAGATNQGHYDTTNSYAAPQNPNDASHDDCKYSIYCTYTAPPSAGLGTGLLPPPIQLFGVT